MKHGRIGVRDAQRDGGAGHPLARKDRADFRIDETGMKHMADRCDLDLFKKLDDIGVDLLRHGIDDKHKSFSDQSTWWFATGTLARTLAE